MRTINSFRSLIGVLCMFSGMLCACSSNETAPETGGGNKTVEFLVTNYVQYDMDEGTRAAISVGNSERIKHLAMGIFDVTTNQLVGSVQVQDKGSAGYGTFTATLNYGKYWLVFLGYGGDNTVLTMTDLENISFGDNVVPQTFLSSFEFTVDANTAAVTDIVLKRVVSGFQLNIQDAISNRTSTIKFKTTRGGMVLNAKTGLAKASTGREYSIDIPENYKGQTGKSLNIYLFLPQNEETMDITASAIDKNGDAFIERTFTGVPMKINTLTIYKGNFFADTPYGFTIQVDDDWGNQVENTF